MYTIVMVLKSNPLLSARNQRPMLAQYILSDQALDSVFIRNFRQRVICFISSNSDFNDLTYNQVEALLAITYVTIEEHKILNNPVSIIIEIFQLVVDKYRGN